LEDQEDSLVFFSIIVSQNVKSGQAEGIPFPLGFNGASRDLVSLLFWVWIWIWIGFGFEFEFEFGFGFGFGLESQIDQLLENVKPWLLA
jgi:hypothetical protein